mgnify:CR=1 FL=1
MERETKRKVFRGKVVSDKMDKTIVVVVDTYKNDPLYNKRFKVSKKFHVHDEQNECKIGDIVTFAETRPLSRTKSFRLIKVLEKAVVI